MSPVLRIAVALLGLSAASAAAGVWLFPVDVFQGWNVGRAGDDPYARFEAAGQAEALVWFARIALPAIALVIIRAVTRWPTFVAAASAAGIGFLRATQVRSSDEKSTHTGWRTWVWRGFITLWLGLFAVHAVHGVVDRGRDWAYFRFNSGADVLPNMSFENRAVIRYLQQATPEDARILACSDQSLFFLAYYLRPRKVFHFVHPEAEFLIPQPGQERPLPAYRLEDLNDEEVAEMRPDFVLEYFEGASFVGPSSGVYRARLGEDPAWVALWRRTSGGGDLPPYFVSLRPYRNASAGSGP